MCGIVGIVSKNEFSSRELLSFLKKLEYRGYDSAGLAILTADKFSIQKSVGKIAELEKKLRDVSGKLGVSHTRWSTTGKVTEENSHPHMSCDEKIAVVHNGVIENYTEIRDELVKKGHKFRSETDTEVIPHLIEENLKTMNFETAVLRTFEKLKGRNAFIVVNTGGDMIAAKNGSPLVAGIADDKFFIASDIPAFIKNTRKVIFLEDGEVVKINSKMEFIETKYSKDLSKRIQEITWKVEDAQKGNYPHFLIKEIMDQKQTIRAAAAQNDEEILKISDAINKSFGSFIIACGTAGHAALEASYFFSKIAQKHINYMVASEFPSQHHFLTDKSLVLAISQSGETADVLEAIKYAKQKNSKIISIVNVPGSSLMRCSDHYFLTNAGPEIAVCSTKAFTSQLSVGLLLAYAAAGKLDEGKKLLMNTSQKVGEMLDDNMTRKIQELAKLLAHKEHIYIIGKGFNYPTALEAALKIKEVSYIHAEGFASGELKHGVIALIDKGTPCIAIVANDENKNDVLTGAGEIKSRGGYIIGIAPENNDVFDFWIPVPDVGNASPIVNVIPTQLLTYYLAIERGCDPDYCRNLAKSVTVL